MGSFPEMNPLFSPSSSHVQFSASEFSFVGGKRGFLVAELEKEVPKIREFIRYL